MKKPTISIIAAIDNNGGLSKNNQLPWYIPDDLKHFREVTLYHPVIMGRKTFESISRPLENRVNIVLSTNKLLKIHGCILVNSIKEALEVAAKYDKNEIFIIGGSEVYNQSINFVDKLYLTVIESEFDVDSYFPEYKKKFKVISSKKHDNDGVKFSFKELIRLEKH